MSTEHINELAGRIEGLSWAVLRLTAALEVKGLIDGPQLSKAWRGSLASRSEDTQMRRDAREYLEKLAALLDDARSHRQ